MQNCLQTKKRAKSVKLLFVCLALLLALVAIATMLTAKTPDYKYLSPKEAAYGQKGEGGGASFARDEGKMNNESAEVAKIHNSDSFHGTIRLDLPSDVPVLMKNGGVKQMKLEDYVAGCVLGEMPLEFESQALMAQSVAVRSFTARMLHLGSPKHKNAAVCTNPSCCQSYISPDSLEIAKENLSKLYGAVNATKGIIVTYDGVPIEAVYHASSGNQTLDSEDVWGGRVEYLRSVKAPDGEEAISVSGMGHRVGMSQHGANLLAKEGKNYMQILTYYYSGVSLGFI